MSASARTVNIQPQMEAYGRKCLRRIRPHRADSNEFWVIVARGIHPFPSRTRKLSPSAPMVLHAQVCGRVGRRPINSMKPR